MSHMEKFKSFIQTSLIEHPNKTQVVNFSTTLDDIVTKINQLPNSLSVEPEAIDAILSPSLCLIKQVLDLPSFSQDDDARKEEEALTISKINDEILSRITPLLHKFEEDREQAFRNGDINVADQAMWKLADLQEKAIPLVLTKLHHFQKWQEENQKLIRPRIHSVQKEAFQLSLRKKELQQQQDSKNIFTRLEEIVAQSCSAVRARSDRYHEETIATHIFETHKEHLKYFRLLYLTLGRIIYKKQKEIQRIQNQIRTTHVQLEFCLETFDSQAKIHTEEKKRLFKELEQVEEVLRDLETRQGMALEVFNKESDEALSSACFDFQHPVDELEDENLSRRGPMTWSGPARLAPTSEAVKKAAMEEQERRENKIKQQQENILKKVVQPPTPKEQLDNDIEKAERELEEKRREVEVAERKLNYLLKLRQS